jgi:hypothetical protein
MGLDLKPQKSTKRGEKALVFADLREPKMEAPETTPDPFQTVSRGTFAVRTTTSSTKTPLIL